MKLKFVGFLFLSALIISGCSTTGSGSGIQSSMEIQPKRIVQLERDMQEVKSRISKLETMLSGNNKTNEVVIVGEGWKSLDSWRKLKTGMNYESVKEILGSAHKVHGGNVARWYYENGGEVTFMEGKVFQWMEPN
jgi:outer membrane protein assembly factor BamE (lipoprotein component of BamABCDE complex)